MWSSALWVTLARLTDVSCITPAKGAFWHAESFPQMTMCTSNNVGTFGVASASYWGSGLRLVHELIGPEMPVEMLIFADDLEALGPDRQGRRGVVLAFLYLAVLGFPFKWAKQRGGLKVEWIGLLLITPAWTWSFASRATWLQNGTKGLADSGKCNCEGDGAGSWTFVFRCKRSLVERPFLGPLFLGQLR